MAESWPKTQPKTEGEKIAGDILNHKINNIWICKDLNNKYSTEKEKKFVRLAACLKQYCGFGRFSSESGSDFSNGLSTDPDPDPDPSP
jgi:hypothetical protein